jgi:hypothetical protein
VKSSLRFHLLQLDAKSFIFGLLLLKSLSVHFEVKLLELRVNHVRRYVCYMLLNFFYLIFCEACVNRKIIQLEELDVLKLCVWVPFHSLALLLHYWWHVYLERRNRDFGGRDI